MIFFRFLCNKKEFFFITYKGWLNKSSCSKKLRIRKNIAIIPLWRNFSHIRVCYPFLSCFFAWSTRRHKAPQFWHWKMGPKSRGTSGPNSIRLFPISNWAKSRTVKQKNTIWTTSSRSRCTPSTVTPYCTSTSGMRTASYKELWSYVKLQGEDAARPLCAIVAGSDKPEEANFRILARRAFANYPSLVLRINGGEFSAKNPLRLVKAYEELIY